LFSSSLSFVNIFMIMSYTCVYVYIIVLFFPFLSDIDASSIISLFICYAFYPQLMIYWCIMQSFSSPFLWYFIQNPYSHRMIWILQMTAQWYIIFRCRYSSKYLTFQYKNLHRIFNENMISLSVVIRYSHGMYCHYNMTMLEYTFIREQVYVPHSCYTLYKWSNSAYIWH